MPYDVPNFAIEPVVDGMIDLLKTNLVANTFLTADAHAGDSVLHVDNSKRFNKFEYILMLDNNCTQNQTTGELSGVEFHKVDTEFQETGLLYLSEPLHRDFLVSDYGRLQKTIKKVPLNEKDVLYGDRQVINFDFVAICVEPESHSQEWLAVRLLGHEYRMSILVYAKSGGTSLDEEFAMRVCNTYADAINRLLMGNIHLDLSFDSVPLIRDAHIGDEGVWISCDAAQEWTAGEECRNYEVQDNRGANQLLKIVDTDTSSSSSSESSLTIGGASSTSSSSEISSSSKTDESSSSSSSSWSSQSVSPGTISTSLTSVSSESSSESSESTAGMNACFVKLSSALTRDFLVSDKAVLRHKSKYTYDSRVDNIEYGTVQKGSALLKAAKLSWFGKEAEAFQFPQVGIGRSPKNN